LSPSFPEQAKRLMNAAFDESKEYRFMEALRNHVLHYAPPVHKIAPSRSGTYSEGRADSVSFICLREYLEENAKFKPAVLAESDAETDLRSCVRYYVAALGRVHIQLRRAASAEVEKARAVVQSALDEFAAENEGESSGLYVGIEQDDGEYAGNVSILLKWDDARKKLVERNLHPALMHL